jgi:G6PDH family F420-dependent oxidoreductase
LKISLVFDVDFPTTTRDLVILAEKVGFERVWIADHFMPWVHIGKTPAPFVWSLIGSCFERTEKISIGPFVTTPIGGRYHPAIIAQAAATLDSMYPGRLRIAVGTGEAINEGHFLSGWPRHSERLDRLAEGVQLIRKLWESEYFFDFQGHYFTMNQIYLYMKPLKIPPIYFSGMGPKSAFYAGKFGDNLVTLVINISSVGVTLESLRDKIFPSFEAGAREAGKDPARMERLVGLPGLTFQSREKVLVTSRQFGGIYTKGTVDERDPRKIEVRDSSTVTDDELLKGSIFCSNWDDVIDALEEFQKIGTTEVALFADNQNTIEQYSENILPHFASSP